MDQLRSSIERVISAGAMTCAPRELALARAHYDFAQTELLHGDAKRALRHLAMAEANVGAAQLLTPDRGCKSANQTNQNSLEADGGGHPALPSGAVKALGARVASDARELTLTAYERIGAASALTASQVTYAACDRRSSERHKQYTPSTVKQASLTPGIYGERRLDGSLEMSYVVLSIGAFEP